MTSRIMARLRIAEIDVFLFYMELCRAWELHSAVISPPISADIFILLDSRLLSYRCVNNEYC